MILQVWHTLWVDKWVWQYKRLPRATAEELHCAGRNECFAMEMVVLPHSRHQLGLHQRIQPVRLGQGSGVQLQDLQVDLFLLHKLRLPKVPGESHDPIINYILIDYILINYSFINCIFINYIVANYIAVNCIVLNAIISIRCFVISPPCLTRRSLVYFPQQI